MFNAYTNFPTFNRKINILYEMVGPICNRKLFLAKRFSGEMWTGCDPPIETDGWMEK